MIFTVTERGIYKRCRRQWSYMREGLTPLTPAPALFLGTLVHSSLEDWFAQPEAPLNQLFLKHAAVAMQGIKDRYQEVTRNKISIQEIDPLRESLEMGLGMMMNYQQVYKKPLPDGYKLVFPEQQLLLKVPRTEHHLEAKLDAIIERNGVYYVMEHKTYAKRPNINDLENHDQMLAYCWAASTALGRPVQNILYNGMMKKTVPSKGQEISDLFFRQVFTRPEQELTSFTDQLSCELNEMGSSPAIYPHRRWEGCWDCKTYTKLCEAQSKHPETYELMRKHEFAIQERELNLIEVE